MVPGSRQYLPQTMRAEPCRVIPRRCRHANLPLYPRFRLSLPDEIGVQRSNMHSIILRAASAREEACARRAAAERAMLPLRAAAPEQHASDTDTASAPCATITAMPETFAETTSDIEFYHVIQSSAPLE